MKTIIHKKGTYLTNTFYNSSILVVLREGLVANNVKTVWPYESQPYTGHGIGKEEFKVVSEVDFVVARLTGNLPEETYDENK